MFCFCILISRLVYFFFVKKDISNLCKINSQLKYYAIWYSELSLNKNWKVFSEKSIPRFFTVHHISATCHHFKVGQKNLKKSSTKNSSNEMNRLHGIFFQKNIYSSFESKICFFMEKARKKKERRKNREINLPFYFTSFFFSIWKSDSLCIYKTLTTILITIFYQRMLHNATSFRISSLLVMKLVLPEIVYLGSGKTKFGFWGLFNLPLKTPLLHISGNSGYKPICHKSIHY